MAAANRLFQHTFDGAGYPSFNVTWPGFTFQHGFAGVNPSISEPVVDGYGRGGASRVQGTILWRGKSDYSPGRSDYQASVWAIWKNAGFAGDREVRLLLRMVDARNVLECRLRSMGTGSPQLRLFKVVNGVETQLGSTYTGAPISASLLNAGITIMARVEDLADGTTRLTAYTGSDLAAAQKGTARIDYTGDLSPFRGAHTVGVGIGGVTQWGDLWVDNLEVYDLADEWNPAIGAPAVGQGWVVEIGNTLYRLSDLAALNPPIRLEYVRQAYSAGGDSGNEAAFRIDGDWRLNTVLYPGRPVRIYHDGAVRFVGEVGPGTLRCQPTEQQTWTCRDPMWLSRRVQSRADDRTPGYYFNITDRKAEEYDATQQNKTVGQVLRWLFDRHVADLRFYGAAPPIGSPYVTTELDALDAVIWNLAVRGTFLEMVLALLRYHPDVLPWVDPSTKVWHFVRITSLSDEAVRCPTDYATFDVQPDPEQSYTRIVWRGAKREDQDQVTLKLSDGSLRPAWTDAQATGEGTGKARRRRGVARVTAIGAGTGTCPGDGLIHAYIDVSADEGLLEDEFRGGICTVDGSGEISPAWIVDMTSTRVWLSYSAWSGGTPPTTPAGAQLSLVDPDAIPELSANGVGNVFLLPPAVLCPGAGGFGGAALKQGGFCGTAIVKATGDDGQTYAEQYEYAVKAMTAAQASAGFCDSLIVLADKPKPPIGLTNKLPPPGGSPPLDPCRIGSNPARSGGVEVEVQVPRVEEYAVELVEPPDVDGRPTFSGPAYSEDSALWGTLSGPAASDWGVRQTLYVDDPNLVDEATQGAGIRKAMTALLNVLGHKVFMWTLRLASPWAATGVAPWATAGAATTRFAGLAKRLTLFADDATQTGFQDSSKTNLPIFSVTWEVEENATVLRAGTVSGWLKADAQAVAQRFTTRAALKRAAELIKGVEDFRNALLAKSADRVRGSSAGPIDGCNVTVANENTRRVTNVQTDDEDKEEQVHRGAVKGLVMDSLFGGGVEAFHAGDQPDVPGLDGAAAKQAPDGPVLRPLARHDVPFHGPVAAPNGDGGAYGGVIETDRALAGGASRQLWRTGSIAFRLKADGAGNPHGATEVEWSPVGGNGVASGPWNTYRTPADLPDGLVPLGWLLAGSTQHQLLMRTAELARRLGVVEDDQRRFAEPGAVTTDHPDGVPVDLVTSLRVAGAVSDGLRLVPESFSDRGGPVWRGPMNDEGVDAGLLWRVHPRALVLARVDAVTPGTGTNGGAFDWDTSGPGGTTEYMTRGAIVHKQVDAPSLRDSKLEAQRTTVAHADDPFCLFGAGGRVLTSAGVSGAGGVLSMPPTARGTPVFTAHVKEYLQDTPAVSGRTIVAKFKWAYQASAWSAVSSGSNQTAAETDGSGTGTGQFKAPGGAIPPGLRKPFDAAIVVVRDPSAGTHTGNAVLTGIGVDVAVVEGGYLLAIAEGVDVGDALVHNHPWGSEAPSVADAVALTLTKALSEGVGVSESVGAEANAPVWESETPEVGDTLALTTTKALADGAGVGDSVVLTLNP